VLPFTKRNVRSEDDQDELLETGEIEVVQTELRAAVEGARPQVQQARAKTEQQYGQRRASVRKIGSPGSPGGGPSSGPQSNSQAQGPASAPRYHSSIGGSVSLGAINEALGAMSTEPAFADRDERPVAPQPRAIVRTPAPAPSPLLAPPPSRASTRLPSPTAAMSAAPPRRRDDDATIARPLSSRPPPVAETRARRVSPPAGGIAVPTPLDELEQTNAVMPLSMPAMDAMTDEVFANAPSAGATGFQLQTPPTIMAGGGAMSTEFRAQVLQQMQAARAGQAQTAMDQMIAQQLANVQRAQPIPDPSSPAVTQLSAQAFPAQALTDVAGPAFPISPTGGAASSPMPGAIRPPGTPLSTSNVDPPGTAVTARTKVRFGNPAMSWAAGLLVVGACVGAAVFVMWRNDSRAEAAAQAARSVQAAAAAQQAQMASTGTYLGQNGLPATGAAPAVPSPANPQAAAAAAPYGGIPTTGAAGNIAAPSASTSAAAAALTAAALNDGTTGMGGTLAPGNGSQPVMALTPAQLAVMTGGAPAAAAAAPPPAAAAAAAPAGGSGAADDGSSHHHHHAAAVAANDTPAPRPAPAPRAAAPAPAPRPAPAPVARKAAPAAGSDDMDSAAKALAKAQLEQSL
jgi:hypothetical protein